MRGQKGVLRRLRQNSFPKFPIHSMRWKFTVVQLLIFACLAQLLVSLSNHRWLTSQPNTTRVDNIVRRHPVRVRRFEITMIDQ